jgi:hypothetical protein
MENEMPPPYSSVGQGPSEHRAAAEAGALLDHLTERVNEQDVRREDYPPGVQAIINRETERIRNMLEFTLAVDYQAYTTASLSANDREHFLHINKALRQLRSTVVLQSRRPGDEVRPNREERQVFAAYFWKYLFEPCRALSLPLDFVYNSIDALSKYLDSKGSYKGSVFGLLQQDGVERLAAKLYWDRHVMIPTVFTDYTSRNRMLHGVNAIEELYFRSISGVEGSTLSRTNGQGIKMVYNVSYEANERGIAYAASSKAAIAHAGKELSTKHWTKAVGQCVDSVLARFKLVKDGKLKPHYPWATWRGEDTILPIFRRPMDAVAPVGWWRLCSYHAPDYCEFRDQVLTNDC